MKKFSFKKKKNLSTETDLSPIRIKWVSNVIFLLILEKILIISKYDIIEKKIKIKKLFCHSKICDIELSLSKKTLIIPTHDGCLQAKFGYSPTKFQIFFF